MKTKPHQRHDQQNHPDNPVLSRREFLYALGAAAAGLVLTGCKPKETSTAVPPSPQPTATVVQAAGPQPTVAIARAASYDPKLVRQQVQALLDGIGGVSDVLNHGNRVAIKVNLTGGTTQPPLPGISEIESYLTHPEVVRALGELLRDAGVTQLFIVEAAYEPGSWPQYGYTDMAKSIDATLVDLTSTQPYKDFAVTPVPKDPFIYDKFTFNPILNEVDAFVSVSKMKCHATCGVTHTMKNLVGLVPYRFYTQSPGDQYRSGFHGTGGDPNKRLPRVILDLNRARPVNLGLIDGIWTIERGEGPWVNGVALVKPGVLFAGKDPVATDSVATAAMGFDPTTDYPNQPFLHADNHLNIAKSLGLGTNRLEEIKVVGATIDEVRFQFKPSY